MNVLIVEDNKDSRNLLVKQLSAYGHEVVAAVDGVDALEKALKTPPDILVSDILMPRMDGYKLCYEWKQHKRLKDIPFVFYTAIYTSNEDEKFALSLGANLFIRKPLEPEALARILSQALEQAREGLLPAAEAPPKPSFYLTEYNKRLVAKLEKSEEEVRYISSVLEAIRNTNQLIVRERDKTKLLEGASRILLGVREYRLVWFGLIEEGHKRVIPIASAGIEDGYLDSVKITWDDRPSGRGPTGTAIKTRKPDVIRNILENPRAASWREEALKRGYRSSAAIPLIHGDRVYGALSVYSHQRDGFDDTEIGLLVEVSGDIAFALNAIEEGEKRQRAEEELRESEYYLRKAQQTAHFGSWVWDVGTNRVEFSDEMLNIFGITKEQFEGTPEYTNSLVMPEDRARVQKCNEELLIRHKPTSMEYSIIRPDGSVRHLWGNGEVELDDKGNLQRLIGTVLDITERKQAEKALRESEEKYRGLADSITDVFFAFDKDLRYVYWNKASEELTGISAKDALGKHLRDLFPASEMTENAEKMYLKALRTQKVQRFVNESQLGGKDYFFEINAYPSKDGLSVFTKDITERKEAEEALRESEAFRSGLLTNSPTPIDVIYPDGLIRYVNPALERLTGFSAEELIGQKAPYPYWPKEKEAVDEIMKSLKKAMLRGCDRLEELYHKKSGEKFWVEITSTPVKKDGEFQYLLSSWVDITERKQAEEKLRESEARYRAVIEGAHDMIQSVGLDGSIIFVNKSWLDTLGYTEAELSSLNLFDIIHPDSLAHCQEMFAKVVKGKPIYSVEAAFLTKDGRKILVEGNAAPRYIGNKVVATQGIFRDVTESKLKERDYQNIIHTTTDGFWIVDSAGRFLDVNNAYCALIGYSREELLNMNIADIEAVEKPEDIARRIRRIIKTGHDRFETHHRCKDGRIVDIDVSTTYAGAGDGRFFVFIRDITARKKAEDALRESEAFQSGLLANSPIPIDVINADSSIRYVNPALERLSGYSAEELLWRKAPYPYWPEEEADKIMKGFKKAMRRGGDRVEESFKRKNGEKFWVEITSTPVKKDGKFHYLLDSWVDITERKKAEEKLIDEATRHRILIDQSRDGIVILDENGKVYEANLKFAEMLRYSPEEVRELHVWDWEVQYEREQVAEMIRTVDEAGDHFETRHRRKDGTMFDVEISTNGAVYAGQKLVFCVCRDITARKQAEAALKESEEKYKTLVETTSDIIWEVDAEGRFTFISPKVKDVLGYEVDEVVGKKRTLDLIAKGQSQRWLKRFKELNAKREPFFGLEITHVHKDGRQVICEISGIPLFDSAGKFKGYVGINRDITERRKMQEQLVITDRLASVGELAAGIAHELNNPLTGVVGFSQLLMEKELPEDIKEDVQMVYQEAQRASQVVKNLLTFARKHAAAKERVNMNEVINKVLELRAYEQNLENIKVKAHYDSALPEVMADYFQLQQVFLNIVINAEYFMKEANHKGNLTITTEKVGNKIRASFADDGPGIAKENLGHIFDPFFTTKEVGRGTGLGLSICHGIVAEHGGRIYVESELGKGATFIVELPIGAAEGKKGGAL